MKKGRPSKLRVKKTYSRKRGPAAKGAKNPKQLSATMGRRRVRRTRRKRR